MTPRYRSFTIRILSKDEDVQLELAQVDDKQMLIATDLKPIAEQTFTQEAYGLCGPLYDREIEDICGTLRERLMAKRRMQDLP
jgi:hypothetical protein